MKYVLCPECEKNKIYMSQANMYVCRNCGIIFKPLDSEGHFLRAVIIKQQEKLIENYKQLQSNSDDIIQKQRMLISKLEAVKKLRK